MNLNGPVVNLGVQRKSTPKIGLHHPNFQAIFKLIWNSITLIKEKITYKSASSRPNPNLMQAGPEDA